MKLTLLDLMLSNLAKPWAVAVLLLLAGSLLRKNSAQRRDDFWTALGLTLFPLITFPSHTFLIWYCGSVDRQLWAMDEAIGFHHLPLLAWSARHIEIGRVMLAAWNWLPLILVVAWLANQSHAYRRALLIGGIGVWFFYAIFPAAGPIYLVTGRELEAARNCMPSLHVTFAILAAWNVRGHWRWLLWAYAVLTCIAVLILGEHYLVDVLAAIPYAAFVQVVAVMRFASVFPRELPYYVETRLD